MHTGNLDEKKADSPSEDLVKRENSHTGTCFSNAKYVLFSTSIYVKHLAGLHSPAFLSGARIV